MKKIITLLLALTMVLSLAACGGKNDAPPPVEKGSGGVAVHDPLEGATGEGQAAAGTDATPMSEALPVKAPVYKEYSFPYMGISFVSPQELRDMLQSGEAWTSYDVQWETDGVDFDYAFQYFSLCEKDNLAKDMFDTQEEYEAFLASTKLFGAITVVKSEYLKDNKIESITNCKENNEIGKSSDGKYLFYSSTNEVNKMTELFQKTEVTTTDPTPMPENSCARIYDGPHKQ